MPTWKLIVEYDGTDLCGWQRQINGLTVQEVLETALQKIHGGEEIKTMAAGRTDSGVHARGQVVSFTSQRELPLRAYERGLNTCLPLSVAVRNAVIAPPGFDARRWALGKRYEYRLVRTRFRTPMRERYSWMVYRRLDLEKMRTAAAMLVGKNDFAAFRASNCTARTTVREMRRVDLREEGDELILTFEATAFLKQMVRNLVGTIVEIGEGRRSLATLPVLLAERDRTKAGPTAPPQGLCLDEVFYDLDAGPPRRSAPSESDE